MSDLRDVEICRLQEEVGNLRETVEQMRRHTLLDQSLISDLVLERNTLRAEITATAAFLDGLADRMDRWSPELRDEADECRAEAKKLRGET